MAGNYTDLDEKSFDDFISKGNVIVDFWASWCGPCKIMAPEFEAASEENKDVKFGKVNVEENQSLAQKFGVLSIPTLILFKDGKQVEDSQGVLKKDEILSLIKKKL